MLQTSWGEIQPRPVWFAGVPDLTPDQLQTFLREAQSFFMSSARTLLRKPPHVFPPLEVVGLKKKIPPKWRHGVMVL